MTIDLGRYLIFLMVMLRMTGLFVANPIFGRSNVPTYANIGLALFLAVLLTGSMDFAPLGDPSLLAFVLMAVRELAVGAVAGFVLRLFMSVMTIGGEIIDMQLGLSMAKNFDPGTNASVSLSATMYGAMFVLIFFVTNNHLTLIHMAAQTFRLIPLGATAFNPYALYYLPELFSSILIFAVKLCMPIVVVEIIVTLAAGIVMRIIPQINIFVLSIQFKLLIGFFALVVLVAPFTAYFENLLVLCFERVQEVWMYFL